MFITIESTEGGGKGSMCEQVGSFCEAYEIPYCHVRQPGGTPLGERIRELFLDSSGDTMTVQEEVMLMAVDRKRVFEEVIRPAAGEGKLVICERWHASTLAYQAYARSDGSPHLIHAMSCYIQETFLSLGLIDIVPDVSVLLTMTAETGLNRILHREWLDRFETQPLSFHQRASAAFHKIHKDKPRWCMKDSHFIDSAQSIGWLVQDFLKEMGRRGAIKKSYVDDYYQKLTSSFEVES